MKRTSFVFSLQDVTHLGQTALQGVEESFLKVFFESHSLKNGSEGLRSSRVYLRNVKDAVGEGFHGYLKVIVFQTVRGNLDNFRDASFNVALHSKHIKLDEVHNFDELYK